MRLSERPNLLILKNLLQSAEATAAGLSVIAKEATRTDLEDVVRHGLFVLAVARVETMLTDTLKYYLSVIPQKIDKDNLAVSKEDILAHQFDLIEVQIEKLLHGLSYKAIHDMLDYFCSTLSLDAKAAELAAPLREIKATRNILLHNNLVCNCAYLELAGQQARTNRPGTSLNITASYLSESVITLSSFVEEIMRLISAKYKEYTKLAAIKRLWAFTFKSPIMPFDDFWVADEKGDKIRFRKKGEREGCISGSETQFLSVWRAHFSGHASDLKAITMYTFDSDNQAKVLYLLSVFRHFRI